MKIAFASDDGKGIAAHFGHCACFLVLDVEGGRLTGREVRRPSAGQDPSAHEHDGGCRCGDKHKDRFDMLADCTAVVTLGMGPKAIAALQAAGVGAIVLSEPMPPEAAALAYEQGRLSVLPEGRSGCCCHG